MCTLELAFSCFWEPFCPTVNKPCLAFRWWDTTRGEAPVITVFPASQLKFQTCVYWEVICSFSFIEPAKIGRTAQTIYRIIRDSNVCFFKPLSFGVVYYAVKVKLMHSPPSFVLILWLLLLYILPLHVIITYSVIVITITVLIIVVVLNCQYSSYLPMYLPFFK